MKRIFSFIVVILFISCSPVYDSIDGHRVKEIRIIRYNNYYESVPVSEVIVTNKRDVQDILRPLRFLFFWNLETIDFKNFTDSRTEIYFISRNNSSKLLCIRNGRLEVSRNQFYKKNQLKEDRFIEIISQF